MVTRRIKTKTIKQPAKTEIVFAPASNAQSEFLMSTSFFTLYGGAVFAGKSMCLLGSFLPICHHPGTRAICIRKTTKQITGAGSLFDAAIQLYSKVDPKLKIRSRDMILQFSSGATIQFTYLDKPADRMNLQGKEFSHIMLDECQQLSIDNVLYAASRLRSTIVDYPLRIVASCNPDADCWLREWVEFALDERGIPIRKDKYDERYFVRTQAGMQWFDTLSEAQALYGTSPEAGIKSFKFVPGTILDNPIGMALNRDYISTLKALPRVEMERLLLGSWHARESASGYFKRDWVTLVDYPSVHATKRVRSWDLASSLPSEVRPSPDATAGVLMSRDRSGVVTVEDVRLMRNRIHEVEKLIFETAYNDTPDVTITIPLDPGATAGAYCRDLARRLSEQGFYVKLIRPEKGKLQRFLPFASAAEAKFVNVLRADWNEGFFIELENMDFTAKYHDDQADACSDGYYQLNRSIEIPNFTLPDLSSPAAFSFS